MTSVPTSGEISPWPLMLSNDFTVPNNFMGEFLSVARAGMAPAG
jgi:hypothetical protein